MTFTPKLTPEQIKEIQDAPAYYRNEYFARLYKVSVSRINQIRNRHDADK
jgi:hypothetical protein